MLKFTILSDVQSELMQGGTPGPGNGNGCKPPRKTKRCWSNGDSRHNGYVRSTTKNVTVTGRQVTNSAAIVLGGHRSSAVSEVNQTMNITATV